MDDQPRRGESCAIVSVILGIILSWVGVLSAVALLVLSSEWFRKLLLKLIP